MRERSRRHANRRSAARQPPNMRPPAKHRAKTRLSVLLAGIAMAASAMAASALAGSAHGTAAPTLYAPLPASNYSVRPACARPARGSAQCLAVELMPRTAAARRHRTPLGRVRRSAISRGTPAEGAYGLRPSDIHSAYNLPKTAPSLQTIALVDAYNDPNAQADLAAYDDEFRLGECTEENGCFERVNQNGETGNLPPPASEQAIDEYEKHQEFELSGELRGWIFEMSLDIEITRATCQNCHILLVEANTSSVADLEAAERTAERLGATEISNSWGSPGAEVTAAEDSGSPLNDPGTVITAASGDDGYLDWGAGSEGGSADYPATSPHVVAVGGTRLELGPEGEWESESVWNDSHGASGGGCSTELTAPAWQQALANWASVGCGTHRASVDIAADADPLTGAAIYDSTEDSRQGRKAPLVHNRRDQPRLAAHRQRLRTRRRRAFGPDRSRDHL